MDILYGSVMHGQGVSRRPFPTILTSSPDKQPGGIPLGGSSSWRLGVPSVKGVHGHLDTHR